MYQTVYDVVVAGGGTAGIGAALSAARSGANVLLLEKNAAVGGTMASGLPFIDFFSCNGEQLVAGIAQELIDRLAKERATLGHIHTQNGHLHSITMIDPEWVKLVAENMLLEAGCNVLYHTFVCAARVEGNRLTAITIANKDGLHEISAKCFIDTTGDGDVAAFAGVPFEVGRPSDHLCQAMSYLFKLGDVDVEKVTGLFSENPIVAKPEGGDHAHNLHVSGKLSQWNDILAADQVFDHPDHNIWAGTMRENELTYVNTVRIVGKNAANAIELSEAEILGRQQMQKVMRFLVKHVPGMEKAHITSTPNGIGIRESRRILGEYVINKEDVMQGRRFDDAIVRWGYPVDIHDPGGKAWSAKQIEAKDGYYEVPYRCLVPQKVDGLLVAGRCISATHEAQATVRIMACCVGDGEAAGMAAAMCASEGIVPRAVDTDALRDGLRKRGALL